MRDVYDAADDPTVSNIKGEFIVFNGVFKGHDPDDLDHNPKITKRKRGEKRQDFCSICRWENLEKKTKVIDDIHDITRVMGLPKATTEEIAEALIDLEEQL